MKSPTRDAYYERICKVLSVVLGDLDAEYSHTDLADLAGYSSFHFQRAFRALTGESPADLLRRFRLERAAFLLSSSSEPVGTIAFAARYESHEAFSRAFRQAFGVTAREFRSESLKSFSLASPVGLHFNLPGEFVPLNHRSPHVAYEIREVPPFGFSGLKHQGSFQFAHRTWGELFTKLGEEGIDPMPFQWINMADELSDRIAISDIRGSVGMNLSESLRRDWMLQRELGGGRFLTARLVGNGADLVDFWYRLFFECLPHSGLTLRKAPLFQSTLGAEAVGSPFAFETTVFIPVSG